MFLGDIFGPYCIFASKIVNMVAFAAENDVSGTYTIDYVAIDSSGNVAATSRILYVDPESIMQQRAAAAAAAGGKGSVGLSVGVLVAIVGGGVVVLLLLVFFGARWKKAGGGAARGGGSRVAGRRARGVSSAVSHKTNNPVFSAPGVSKRGGGGGRGGRAQELPVPAPEIWYHGAISRVEAEKRLRAAGRASGVYLVRSKEGSDGEFVLSLLTTKKAIHYVIKMPAEPGQHISIQGKPLTSRLVRGLRSVMQYLQKYPEEIIAEPLEHAAPIPHRAPELIQKVAAELGLDTSAIVETDEQIYALSTESAVGGNHTVADRLYQMLTEEYDTYSICGYLGHPSGVYYRVFLALEEIQPHFTLYVRTTANGGPPLTRKVSANDVFGLFPHQKRKAAAAEENIPLYARVAPEELAGFLAGDGMQFADAIYGVVDGTIDAEGEDYEVPVDVWDESGDSYQVPQSDYEPHNNQPGQIEYASYQPTSMVTSKAATPAGKASAVAAAGNNGDGDDGAGSAFVPDDFGADSESSIIYAVYASNDSETGGRGGGSNNGGGGGDRGGGYLKVDPTMALGGGYMHISGVDPAYGNNTLARQRTKEEQDIYKNNTLERKKEGRSQSRMPRVLAPEMGGGYMDVSKSRVSKSRSAAKCTRPSPSGGSCKNDAVKGSFFCTRHTCSEPGCEAGKSAKETACPAHTIGGGGGALYGNVPAGVGKATYGNVPASTGNSKVRKGRASSSSAGSGGGGGGGAEGSRARSKTGGGGIKRDARKGSVYLGFEEAFETNA